MITKEFITNYEGNDVLLYTLDNKNGLTAEIFNYGGIIKSLKIGGRDVALGRDTFEDYLDNDGYIGALVGRHANRMKNASFILNGIEYKVTANENGNSLHGGNIGFDKKVLEVSDYDENGTTLSMILKSPDGEEGYPGNLTLKLTYTLTAENSLKINYEATCDQDTVLNLTNHSYFNLDGHNSGYVYDEILKLDCDFFAPCTDESMPYGEMLSVKGTPFDFTSAKKIGKDINDAHEQLQRAGGFDHCFAIRGRGFRKAGELTSADGHITMECLTDMPGVQIYTANALPEGVYKEGAKYGKHSSVCFETQFFPNSMAISHFIPPVLKKGDTFNSTTEFKFILK